MEVTYDLEQMSWTEDPGGLQSKGSQRAGHDLATKQQRDFTDNSVCAMQSAAYRLQTKAS